MPSQWKGFRYKQWWPFSADLVERDLSAGKNRPIRPPEFLIETILNPSKNHKLKLKIDLIDSDQSFQAELHLEETEKNSKKKDKISMKISKKKFFLIFRLQRNKYNFLTFISLNV